MNETYRAVIQQKIAEMQARPLPMLTRGEAWLPQLADKALVIVGIRYAGKTSLMWQLLADLAAQGCAREGLLYFSFEDDRLRGMQAKDLDLIVDEYYRLNPSWRKQKRAVFFLDDIQLIPGWEAFTRRILDEENIQLYLSGSSIRMLSSEVAEPMRDRLLELRIRPFDFGEFLRRQNMLPANVQRLSKAQRSQLDARLTDYLAQGGFPEAQGLEEGSRLALLRRYIDVMLLRDVLERYNLGQPQVLRWLVQQLLGNAAGSFSIQKLHAELRSHGMSIGRDSLHQMLAHLEDIALVHSLPLATESLRKQQMNPRKIYPVDTGLMALYEPDHKPPLEQALKTVVLHSLLKQGAEVGYFLTENKREIDFHARLPNGKVWLLQICMNAADAQTLAAALQPFADLGVQEPGARHILISLHAADKASIPKNIEQHSACQWLLQTHQKNSSQRDK